MIVAIEDGFGVVVHESWTRGALPLLSRFDELALLLPHVQTALELFAHAGVLCLKAWGQARDAHIFYCESRRLFARQWSRGTTC